MNDSVGDALVPTNGFPEPSSAAPIASIARRSVSRLSANQRPDIRDADHGPEMDHPMTRPAPVSTHRRP
jgi:hypothetical protein